MLESFFIYGDLPPGVEKGDYQLPLVILSYMVASFASYTALALAQQLTAARSAVERPLLHAGGAFAMGAGIWSMHFIGMLSYKMDMKLDYDPGLTLLSMLIAIAFSYGVLGIVAGSRRLTPAYILTGGLLLGIGICSMHYTGMAAMEMDADLRYRPGLFSLSVAIAAAASAAALWIAFTLARHSSRYRYPFMIGAALIMGAAICGMHYTGMAAAVFIPWADCRYDPDQDFDMLAISIAAITTIILGLALAVGAHRKTQTEYQLQNSEKKLRAVIDSALDAVISMDEWGRVTEWNRQAEAIFGWPREQVLGRPLAELVIPPEYREAHLRGIKKFLTEGIGPILDKRIELEAQNRDGSRFPVELTVTAQMLHDKSYQFTAFARDITDRRKNEEATGMLAAIVESSGDAIISMTLKGVITSWNRSAEYLFGYTAAEAIGQHIDIIIPPDRRKEESDIDKQVSSQKRTENLETVRLHKSGRPIDVSLAISPIRDASRKIIGVSKTARDITSRKEAEAKLLEYTQKLEDSNRNLDDFVYIVSHDLKEPIRGIHNYTHFIIEDYGGKLDEEGRNRLLTLQKLSARMEEFINDLLHFTRIGREEISYAATDLNSLIAKTLELMELQIRDENVTISVDKNMPTVRCKTVHIGEVFRNLITNAIKYNDSEHKRVDIGFRTNHPDCPGRQVFFVRDNGIGIPEKYRESVFRMFKRLHGRDEYGGGTGSGLAIIKKIIDRHGGKVWIESGEGGGGSVFCFTLGG